MMYVVVLRTRTRRVVHLLPIPDLFLVKYHAGCFEGCLLSWNSLLEPFVPSLSFSTELALQETASFIIEVHIDERIEAFSYLVIKFLEISPVPLSDTKGWEHNSYYIPSESRGGTNVCQGSGAALQRGCRRLIQGRDVEGHGSPRGGRVYS